MVSDSEQGFTGKQFANQLFITDILKKARNSEVFGLELLRVDFSVQWKALQLGACFICERLCSEGRKEAGNCFSLGRLRKNSLFQPSEPGPLCGCIPGGAIHKHDSVPVHHCSPTWSRFSLRTKLTGHRTGHLEDGRGVIPLS